MSTNYANEFNGAVYGVEPAGATLSAQFKQVQEMQMQAQFEMPAPDPVIEYSEPEIQTSVDINPELLARCENVTMMADMDIKMEPESAGIAELFGAGCQLAEETMAVKADMSPVMPEPDFIPPPAPDPVPEFQNSWLGPKMGMTGMA